MENLFLPENVTKLCDHIFDAIEREDYTNEDISSYIDGLKFLCCGKTEATGLTTEEALSCILHDENVEILFRLHPDFCLKVADVLLSHSHLTTEICKMLKALILNALSRDLNGNLLITKLLNHKDINGVSVDFIEDIILLNWTNLELFLVNLYEENVGTRCEDILWDTHTCKQWVSWCARSSKLYRKLTSIMNQMLLFIENKEVMLKIIDSFVKNVNQVCKKYCLDFIGLYPIKFQSVVSVMNLDPEELDSNNVVLINHVSQQINKMKAENTFEVLLLLTHFNKWDKFI